MATRKPATKTTKQPVKKTTKVSVKEPVKKTTRTKKTETVVKEPVVRKPRVKKTFASPKEEATHNKQPWVGVLETHVNPDNPSNGFFELDWNEYFVVQLKSHGFDGPTEESIVDAWFQSLCKNIGNESGLDMDRRGSGYININNLGNGKSEVS
jgi:hypothetical protein